MLNNNYIIGIFIIIILLIFIFMLMTTQYTATVTVNKFYNPLNVVNDTPIPNIIHRIYNSKELPLPMYQHSYKPWITLNPHYKMIWHSFDDAELFLKHNF